MRGVEYEISGVRISSLPMGEAAVVRAKLDPSPGMNKLVVLPWPVEDCRMLVAINGFVNRGLGDQAMTPHSSTLAWKIPWTEEPGRLQSVGSLRVGHD